MNLLNLTTLHEGNDCRNSPARLAVTLVNLTGRHAGVHRYVRTLRYSPAFTMPLLPGDEDSGVEQPATEQICLEPTEV